MCKVIDKKIIYVYVICMNRITDINQALILINELNDKNLLLKQSINSLEQNINLYEQKIQSLEKNNESLEKNNESLEKSNELLEKEKISLIDENIELRNQVKLLNWRIHIPSARFRAQARISLEKQSCAVFHPRTFLGRLFIRKTAFQYKSRCVTFEKSVFFGKYSRNRPFVFSLLPFCQGLWGSAK